MAPNPGSFQNDTWRYYTLKY